MTRQAKAFTLLEVLLVIVIIGMLATVLIFTIGGTQEQAKIDTTVLTIKKIENKLEEYNLRMGHYPNEAEGSLKALYLKPNYPDEKLAEKWRKPFVKSMELDDAWGNVLNYEAIEAGNQGPSGVSFKLWSNGPDQQSNTEDDIQNWSDNAVEGAE